MGAWRASLDPADVQRSRSELDLIPAEVTDGMVRVAETHPDA